MLDANGEKQLPTLALTLALPPLALTLSLTLTSTLVLA